MSYSYGYEFLDDGSLANLGFFVIYMIIVLGVALLTYVFRAISRYTIAKRRGIKHAWMAWVPILDSWLIGCISDQYKCLVKGKNTKRRNILLVLGILSNILSFIMTFCLIGIMIGSTADPFTGVSENAMIGAAILLVALMLPLTGISIAYAVFYLMSLYDLYASCEPQNAVLYIIMSIFVQITEPIFQFICRNKDDGMPPRRVIPQIDSTGNNQGFNQPL